MNRDLFFQAANARALGSDRVPRVWTVSQVNALTRQLLEGSLPPLWMAGEVSGFKRYSAGHCYFTLKDEKAQIGCVMWREAARALPTEPPDGMAVHVFGYPSLYERAGRYQFVVRELVARGEGLWRLALERARGRLQADGLLDPARKRPLPPYPSCVGVVTSIEGAAVRDIVSVIRRRAPWTDILVYPARVQGDGAAASIVRALRVAARARRTDVLIVGRGGGSVEDLSAFNDERLARTLADLPMPVIAAVGHETDVTLAELVADRRAPTPSAAAELAVPDGERLRAFLDGSGERLAASLRGGLLQRRRRVRGLEGRLVDSLRGLLGRRRLVVDGFRQRLQALGPIEVLRRGYALALDREGRLLRGVDGFVPGESFTLRVRDGRVRARVESVEADPDS